MGVGGKRPGAGEQGSSPAQLPYGLRGCGDYDPETDTWEWYEGDLPGAGHRWSDLLARWPLIEADFHSEYGADLSAPDSPLDCRSWRWFRARIAGLLAADTRLGRAFAPEPRTGRTGRPTPNDDD